MGFQVEDMFISMLFSKHLNSHEKNRRMRKELREEKEESKAKKWDSSNYSSHISFKVEEEVKLKHHKCEVDAIKL